MLVRIGFESGFFLQFLDYEQFWTLLNWFLLFESSKIGLTPLLQGPLLLQPNLLSQRIRLSLLSSTVLDIAYYLALLFEGTILLSELFFPLRYPKTSLEMILRWKLTFTTFLNGNLNILKQFQSKSKLREVQTWLD